MLDLFTIFSKSGIVLWCFQGTTQFFTPSVNALIRTVILQERGGDNSFTHENLVLKYKLDNEFELVFVVAYQKVLQLSYVDKFLDDVHLEFRDKYKACLESGSFFSNFNFSSEFQEVLRSAEEYGRMLATQQKKMRTFEESLKSKKTVASMIENKKDAKPAATKGKEAAKKKPEAPKKEAAAKEAVMNGDAGGDPNDDDIVKNRQKLFEKMQGKKKSDKGAKSPAAAKDKSKKPRIWDHGGKSSDLKTLDYSEGAPPEGEENGRSEDLLTAESRSWVGKGGGEIKDMEYSESEEEMEEEDVHVSSKQKSTKGGKSGGMFGMFRGLVGSKSITAEDMAPVLDKLRDHLIAKNVAADVSQKLCDSVGARLEGRVLGSFTGVASTVRATLVDALVQLLSPKRRVNLLRDVLEAQRASRPFVITFCGVNGVGKSTNLAKICFWLIENNCRVLIAACDTFRAGAVEQLRTHMRHLNALHPPEKHGGKQMVQLYEKGYGKDAAGIAMEAINYARETKVDVVLIDTAGRMQDNEPLMRALAKLITVNKPDLVLFVGEALVGNEAVDQLVKFNQALADHSSEENPHLIDGIVLTKFDTIDDKVGAAISMTYITGQPIVFVGTGQTYIDLKTINAKAVVHALMK
ncbi:signal recognition particle receptor subunit alpha [Rhipicephalus sanguineus]|uniref:signal recognition particle receptor subunit alpha n=1 Tax=Rhipicephalus sanguineus TaxID=34632 RepID=UPI001893F8D7|nr:signal recognition particle receptor subunit alpha [Rhipicephalus sanguineus]